MLVFYCPSVALNFPGRRNRCISDFNICPHICTNKTLEFVVISGSCIDFVLNRNNNEVLEVSHLDHCGYLVTPDFAHMTQTKGVNAQVHQI